MMLCLVCPAVESDTQSVDRNVCRVELIRTSLESFALLFICLGKCNV